MTIESAIKGVLEIAEWHRGKFEQTREEDYKNDAEFLEQVAALLDIRPDRRAEGGDTVELKPCPFCGGEAKIVRSAPYMTQLSEAVCNICGARTRSFEISTAYASDIEAVKAWNRRANDER